MSKQAVALQSHLGGRPAAPASQATHIEQSRAIAEVQAMVIVAQNIPRSEPMAISKIMESCGQKLLAERAFFKFPRGGQTVSGPSIHLATELARCWGNIDYGIKELSRNDDKAESEMIAFAWDVQTNTRAETSFIVPHKRDKRGGAETLTDMRDIYENNANNGARRLREMIFRVIPPYVRYQAEDACRQTLEKGESSEPLPVRIAKMLKAFAEISVSKERIEAKIGMKAEAMTTQDLVNLRISLQSIKRQEVSAEEEFPSVAAATLAAELAGAQQKQEAGDKSLDQEPGGVKEGQQQAASQEDAKAEDPRKPEGSSTAAEPPMADADQVKMLRVGLKEDGSTDWEAWCKEASTIIGKARSDDWLKLWASTHETTLSNLKIAQPTWEVKIQKAIKARFGELAAQTQLNP